MSRLVAHCLLLLPLLSLVPSFNLRTQAKLPVPGHEVRRLKSPLRASALDQWAESLDDAQRLLKVLNLSYDEFKKYADEINVTEEDWKIPEQLESAIKKTAEKVFGRLRKDWLDLRIGGSRLTKTAIKYSSDLDIYIRTEFEVEVARKQRSQFNEMLTYALPPGWEKMPLKQKCMQLKHPKYGEVDIVFLNTAFDNGITDDSDKERERHVEFFKSNESNVTAQRAVRMFKFCFLTTSGLCGFHLEALAMKCSSSDLSRAKDLFCTMLKELKQFGKNLTEVVEAAVNEVDPDDQVERKDKIEKQIKKMQNVIQNAPGQ